MDTIISEQCAFIRSLRSPSCFLAFAGLQSWNSGEERRNRKRIRIRITIRGV